MAENKSPKTFDAGAAVSKYRLVKFDGSMDVIHNTATATDDPVGVSRNSAEAAGEYVTVSLLNEPGTLEVEAGGAISADADVYAAADGKIQALPSGAGDYRKIGKALEAASGDGSIIEILPYDYNHVETVT
ncbi:MAG: DUF2190 family protein [Desulfobacteraceae bacterium]|nr:DUF2190 family protein [Desulfobacteraceae bacterium]